MHWCSHTLYTIPHPTLRNPSLHTPVQVNATGVMPLIFASSILALPTAVARCGEVWEE